MKRKIFIYFMSGYCRYFDETFTAMLLVLLWLYLANSQVSVYRIIGPTLVLFGEIIIVICIIVALCHTISMQNDHFH